MRRKAFKFVGSLEDRAKELKDYEKLLRDIPECRLLNDLSDPKKRSEGIYTVKVFIKVENEIRKKYTDHDYLISILKQKTNMHLKLKWVSNHLENIKRDYEKVGTFYISESSIEDLGICTIDTKEWLGVIKYCADQFDQQDAYELVESKIHGFLELEDLREEINCVYEGLVEASWDSDLKLMHRYIACGVSQIISAIAFNSEEKFTEEMKEETLNEIDAECPTSIIEEITTLAEITVKIKQLEKLMRKENQQNE